MLTINAPCALHCHSSALLKIMQQVFDVILCWYTGSVSVFCALKRQSGQVIVHAAGNVIADCRLCVFVFASRTLKRL